MAPYGSCSLPECLSLGTPFLSIREIWVELIVNAAAFLSLFLLAHAVQTRLATAQNQWHGKFLIFVQPPLSLTFLLPPSLTFDFCSPQDGSGSIDFEEFLNMMTAKMSDKDTREDINKVFNLFDDDQTGHITLRNLKRVAKELGETMSGERSEKLPNTIMSYAGTYRPAGATCRRRALWRGGGWGVGRGYRLVEKEMKACIQHRSKPATSP